MSDKGNKKPELVNLVYLDSPAPYGTPHPITGCKCSEGRLTNEHGQVIVWLPPVHNCHYIATRNARQQRTAQRAEWKEQSRAGHGYEAD